MSRKRSRWLPWWLPWRLRPRSTYVLTWSGWPDSNRRPPAPKLNLVRQRGGLEESCRSTELGSCRQSVSRTFADSTSLGSPTGSPYRRYQNKHWLGGPRSDDRSQPVNWVAPVHQAATVTDGGFAVARVAGPR